jgi:hypothetical protein
LEGVPLASGGLDFSVVVTDQNELADTADLSIDVELAFAEPELVLDGSYVRSNNGYEFVHYDASDHRLCGFCALGSPEGLNNIWFAV